MIEKKIKLLIADDHLLFINGIKLLLKETLGLETTDYAITGKEAIDKCRQQHFDLVLMDINMPLIDGIEAASQIKLQHPETKVVMVSMLSDVNTVGRVMKAGADGFIVKNADPSEFAKAFHTIEKGDIYLSPKLAALINKDNPTRKDYIAFSQSIISPREKAVLKMICEGQTDQQIAETLHLSTHTINTHRKNMLSKLNLSNTALLVKFAIENKLID
jgi:DNA-binding NarL/FixJ family response regulator